MKPRDLFFPAVLGLVLSAMGSGFSRAQDWPTYGGATAGTRYSPLDQINRDNVEALEVAWIYHTGDLDLYPQLNWALSFQATPILLPEEAGGHLVLCTPFNRVAALDPATGEERWLYDPKIKPAPVAGRFNCRGVTQWRDDEAAIDAPCAFRLFLATNDRRLIALDARTGTPCAGFGDGGVVDVTPIIKELPPTNQLVNMQLLSPVGLVNDVIVIGSTANKFKDVGAVNGALRGFDARSGEHLWTFDTLVREDGGEYEPTSYETGGANVWISMSSDDERDLIFAGTASPSPNFYGALRPGDNRYANSVLAIRGSTGELVWHYQVLHHDVWDWDIASHPILADITTDGETIPVVVALPKPGFVFVFHRETGEPYFPIEERPVPTDGIPGDQLSPTQPMPLKPPPLVKQDISVDDAWGFTLIDRAVCRGKIAAMRHGSIYQPPTTQGTVMYPQVGGGPNWGGAAFDPERNLLIVPVTQMPSFVRLIPNDDIDPELAKQPTAGNPNGPPGYIKGAPYGLHQGPLLSSFGAPCTEPPWAMLVAVDLAEGTIKWKVPHGKIDKLSGLPLALRFGTPVAGGAIATGAGLVFAGGTADERFRAYDTQTGALLWEIDGPTAAHATPMTYMANGRQFVVVATGGHNWFYPFKKMDTVVAYALPEG